jgi:two-component system, OmpR family, response regulator MprA
LASERSIFSHLAVTGRRAARWTPRSLLIVDDDDALAGQLQELFRLEGYRVSLALDGLEALQLLASGCDAELVLMDMHMGGLDGWDLARELRALDMRIPLLVITGDADPERCARQVGATAFLAKPFDLPDLIRLVERVLYNA